MALVKMQVTVSRLVVILKDYDAAHGRDADALTAASRSLKMYVGDSNVGV